MDDNRDNEERILTVDGEALTTETVEEKKKRLSEEKAKLEAMLKNGEIDGVEYNRRVVALEVPTEYHAKHQIPKRQKTAALIGLLLLLIAISIPAAIYLNWYHYFQNTLTAAGVPSYLDTIKSSLSEEPIQINFEEEYSETGKYKGRPINITYKAYYDITGIVTSIRDYWGFEAYDTLAPRDLCMIWGELAARYPNPDMKFYHGERICWSEAPAQFFDQSIRGAFGSTHYGSSLISNNHLIPSTAGVRDKFLSFSVGDTVRIVGYLVRVDYDDIRLDSSMTRDDVMFDRSSTTCEIIYVTKAEKLK